MGRNVKALSQENVNPHIALVVGKFMPKRVAADDVIS